MANVFLSYKKEDQEALRRIDTQLRAEGFSVFWDDQLTPDKAWDARLEQELEQADSVVVLWSQRSTASTWVRTEAHYGHDHGKLVPVLIEACAPPLAFKLLQTIDLSSWNGDSADKHWRKLATWIADLVAGRAGAGADAVEGLDPAALTAQHRALIGSLKSGEPIWDGATISAATPAGTAFSDGVGLPVMRIMPAGEFLLGSPPDDPMRRNTEHPQKRIEISRPFAMSVFPLLRSEARSLIAQPANAQTTGKTGLFSGLFGRKAAPETLSQSSAGQVDDDVPVTGLSFAEACGAAARLSELTGETYRLASESEWEYCCRAGSRARYSWGDEARPDLACYQASAPAPCGTYKPNDFGLYDMHGNVREWTLDLWRDDYVQTPADGSPARSGHSAMQVVRGGSFMDGPDMLRSAARARATASLGNPATGVRLVREFRR